MGDLFKFGAAVVLIVAGCITGAIVGSETSDKLNGRIDKYNADQERKRKLAAR